MSLSTVGDTKNAENATENAKVTLTDKREELRAKLKEYNLDDPRTRDARLQAAMQAALEERFE